MELPLHSISHVADTGVAVRRVDFASGDLRTAFPNGMDSHRDDYYIFAVITGGECMVDIDFHRCRFTRGEMICLCPGQVHRFISAGNMHGIGIIVDSALIDDDTRRVIDLYSLDYRPAAISDMQRDTLERILDIIDLRQQPGSGCRSADIVRRLAQAAADTSISTTFTSIRLLLRTLQSRYFAV